MLDEILRQKRKEQSELLRIDKSTLEHATHDFQTALAKPGLSIIAEVKRRSPSEGTLADTVDPVSQAQRYVDGGASAVSVLVDREYFGGDWADLQAVAGAVEVPVLCKEFIIDARQVHRARQTGADACLLIAAALDDEALRLLLGEIESLGMDALVEVHDEEDLGRAIDVDAGIIGVNNRNLKTLEVDPGTVERLARGVPSDRILVAESGYGDVVDIVRLPETVNGLLVGSALMRSDDPAAMLRRWIAAAERSGEA